MLLLYLQKNLIIDKIFTRWNYEINANNINMNIFILTNKFCFSFNFLIIIFLSITANKIKESEDIKMANTKVRVRPNAPKF